MTAWSTGEAEVVAGTDCAQSIFAIAAVLKEFVCQQLFFPHMCTDSGDSGGRKAKAPTRIQLELLLSTCDQRTWVCFVSDSLERTGGEAMKVDSGDNTAAMHTKPLPSIAFTKFRNASLLMF